MKSRRSGQAEDTATIRQRAPTGTPPLVALILTFLFRDEVKVTTWRKFGSTVLMGVAVPVMHYTGIAVASFSAAPLMQDRSRAVSISAVGAADISSVAFMVIAFAILISIIDGSVPSSGGNSFVASVRSTGYAIAARISCAVVDRVGVVSCFMDSALK